MRIVGRVIGVAIVVMLGFTAFTSAAMGGTKPKGNEAFSGLPQPRENQLPTYIGTDSAGTAVALVLTATDQAVAYACGGTGEIGEWFSGPIDTQTGQVNLEGDDGESTLTYDFTQGAGELTIEGTTTTVSLEEATGGAGLYRETQTKGRQRAIIGWIVGNDGLLYGEAAVDGKPVVAVSEDLSQPPPSDESTAIPTTLVETQRFVKPVRCGALLLGARFNVRQRVQNVVTGGLPTQDQIADANADLAAISDRADELGCEF